MPKELNLQPGDAVIFHTSAQHPNADWSLGHVIVNDQGVLGIHLKVRYTQEGRNKINQETFVSIPKDPDGQVIKLPGKDLCGT